MDAPRLSEYPTPVAQPEPVNILMVDDQPGKLLTYEVILQELGENLIKAHSAEEALQLLLKNDIAIVLVDVCMPDLDGFDLVRLIREHPRYQDTAVIFISATYLSDLDRLRGYQAGAVDYIPVPVVPDILRAKVKIFAELYRKTQALARLTGELEQRVAERTAALQASTSQLQESESRLRLAQDAGGVVTWEWHIADGSFTWSRDLGEMLGLELHDGGTSFERMMETVHPDDRARVRSQLREAARSGRPFDSEFRVTCADGQLRWLVQRGEVVCSAGGRPERMRGVAFDGTERRLTQEALERLNAELEQRVEERTSQLVQLQKTEALGQITGGVAHDFNNLLAVIGANLGLLRRRLPDDPRLHSLLEGALQGAERGAELTRRMLAFARKQELKPERVDVAALVRGMNNLLQRSLGPLVRLETHFAKPLPAAFVDPHQLELAVLNLAVNARDVMPEGGRLTIAATEQTIAAGEAAGLAPGVYLRLSVIDEGAGMDEQVLQRATEPFFTTKGVGKGTGLGLSMVHGLMTQSGGALHISSRPGEGTRVDLWLPRARAGDRSGAGALPPAVEPVRLEPLTVLLVDDDRLVRTAVAAQLDAAGHTVLESPSGPHALTLLDSGQRVDLLITDHAMPVMTGAQLIGELRRLRPGLPAILATGYAELPVGVDEVICLQKPFSIDELTALMARLLAPPAAGAVRAAQ